jgi:hypothetical protein
MGWDGVAAGIYGWTPGRAKIQSRGVCYLTRAYALARLRRSGWNFSLEEFRDIIDPVRRT